METRVAKASVRLIPCGHSNPVQHTIKGCEPHQYKVALQASAVGLFELRSGRPCH